MSCDIKLDNYQGRYYAGDVIVGKVICSFPDSEEIRGIVLKLKGKEKNRWTRHSGGRSSTRSDSKKFLRVISVLHDEGGIGPGRFEYPFTFQLPNDLPSTYKGDYGGIAFSLEVKVDRPFAIDYTDKWKFIVFSPINFNLIRDQLELKPVHYSVENILTGCCCDSGTMTMDAHLEKEAFVVGEAINVRVVINNMSNVDVMGVTAELRMKIKSMITHWGGHESKSKHETIASGRAWTIVRANTQESCNITLRIPESTEIPNFSLCKLFSRKTTLVITAGIDGCHMDMDMNLAVTLGHIPVENPTAPADQYPSNPPNTYTPDPYPPSSYQINSDSQPAGQNAVPRPIAFQNGPSAPPTEGEVSAPPERELPGYESAVEGEGPPSYNAAMSSGDGRRTRFS